MPGPARDSWVLLPGVILPAATARKLADVCAHSERTREAVVRHAVEAYIGGYLASIGLADE